METSGLLIEFKDGKIKPANLGMATAAWAPDRQMTALLIDAPTRDLDMDLSAYGVSRIVYLATGHAGWQPAAAAAAVISAMKHFDINHLVGLTSPAGRELLPRIAAGLDAPLVMGCTRIDLATRRVTAPQYSGKTTATIALAGSHFIYGLTPNAVAPETHPVTSEIIEFAPVIQVSPDYQVLETRRDGGSAQYLAEADIIISGGRGLKNGENFKLLFDCARHIGASVGASRVAVDNGWVPYAMQVGQTGVKVNPKVYIAVGLSGSIQHFAGMKTAKLIIAINSDANAAIMANCDYYTVGDLFEIVPALEKALAALHG